MLKIPFLVSAAANAPQVPNHLPNGIREIVAYPPTPVPWLGILIVVAIVVILLILYYWFKRRKKQPVVVPEDPLAVLLAELKSLRMLEPFDHAQQKDFFYQISLGFRRFVELKTGLPATDQTFKELKMTLNQVLPFSDTEKAEVLKFLQFSDMVKFADYHTTNDVAATYHNQVIYWIEHFTAKVSEQSNEEKK